MLDFSSESGFGIARRIELRGPDSWSWMAILCPTEDDDSKLTSLKDELAAVLEISARVVTLQKAEFEELVELLHSPAHDAVVLKLNPDWSAEQWSRFDLMRSSFERNGPIVLWLPASAFAMLSEYAPNIRSFVGPSVFIAGSDGGLMSEEDRRDRLTALGQYYGLTDDEIIQKSQSGTLSPEPHFVEWLILLGRGDLI